MIFWPFTRHDPEKAELRDRCLVAETQVLLLRDLVEHPPQPRRTRERRKDAADIVAMKAATTAALETALGKHRGRE